jgi:hypothetical protein
MDAAEQELRDRRTALNEAVKARDWKVMESFLHPDFYERGILGIPLSRGLVLFLTKVALRLNSRFREDVQVEEVRIEGDKALLTVTRTDTFKLLGVIPRKDIQRCTELWMNTNGRWLMMCHATPIWYGVDGKP